MQFKSRSLSPALAVSSLGSDFDPCGAMDVVKKMQRKMHLIVGKLHAMESCLVQAGLLDHMQIQIEIHRQAFKAACKHSNWTPDPDAEWRAIFQKGVLSSCVTDFFDAASPFHLQLTCGDALASVHKHTSVSYLVGGITAQDKPLSTVECFDAAAGMWQVLPHKMPIRGFGCGAAVLQGRIYLCGVGFDDLSGKVMSMDVHCDPKRAWQVHTSQQGPRTPRMRPAATVLAGKLYMCGGENAHGTQVLSSVERFDPEGEAIWEVMPPMLEARSNCRSAALAGKLVVCGGNLVGTSWPTTIKSSAEMFDAESLSWHAAPSMTAPRTCHCIACFAGRIFVCGGHGERYPYALRSAEMLDPAFGLWTALPSMLEPRAHHSLTILGRKLYICGGENGGPNRNVYAMLTSTECFDAERGVWEPSLPMQEARNGHSSAVLTAWKDKC